MKMAFSEKPKAAISASTMPQEFGLVMVISVSGQPPQAPGDGDYQSGAGKQCGKHAGPAAVAPGPAGRRAEQAAAEVVARQIKRRNQPAPRPGPMADPGAGYRMHGEKAERENAQPDDDQPQ